MRAFRRTILLAACAALVLAATAARGAQYEYDALNRVTKVTYENGHTVSYHYDPAGNITSVFTVGRSSAQVSARLGRGSDHADHGSRFTFHASKGETVTLRFEADPPQAGLGRYIVMSLTGRAEKSKEDDARGTAGKSKDDDVPKAVKDHVLSAVPAELTSVLPFTGEFAVELEQAGGQGSGYRGSFRLTLEASPGACASFKEGH
jgi:YD repeat-containing protein